MSRENARARSRRIRDLVVAGTLGIVTIASALVVASPATAAPAAVAASPAPTATARPTSTPTPKTTPTPTPKPAPRPVGTALAFDLPAGTVLTLPAKDGLRDRTVVHVLSGRSGRIDVDAVRGKKTIRLATGFALAATSTGWSRSITVQVAGLTAGTWRLRAERSSAHTVQARSRTFVVGTGAAVHVAVRPAVRVLYPYKDGVLDTAVVTVVAKDETEQVVPVRGTIRIDAGKLHVTRTLSKADAATVPITSLPVGPAVVTATVTVPGAKKKTVRTTALTLAPTAVGSLRIARSSDTVQPVVDGLLDSVVLTTTGAASAASPAKVSGTLTVSKGKTIAALFPVPDGKQHAFTWDGRVNGVVVPGTYTVSLALKGPQGLVRTKTKTLVVTKAHLPYAVRDMFTVAAGNQQGLAVRNGLFYVGYDVGNDQSRIDVYNGYGVLQTSVGPLPIPHVAELAYSTSTQMLYAATGGASTPTKVFVLDPTDPQWTPGQLTNPSAVIRQTFDLSSTLGNNAMVTVDDANNRLLVFSGATGGFSVSSVTMTATPVLNADGTPALNDDGTAKTVPAGTISATVPVSITGTPQGMDLVGQQLWIYTSIKGMNHVAMYDLSASTLLTAASAGTSADLMWGGEGEGMATVAAPDTGDGLPAWIFVGAHDVLKGGPNRVGELVPVTDQD